MARRAGPASLMVPQELTRADPDEAVSLVRGYFDSSVPGEQFTGAFFERLDGGGDRPSVANRITGADLVALRMLSVRVRDRAAGQLAAKGDDIEHLLSQIRVDRDLAEVDASVIASGSPAWKLWELLLDVPDIGWVTANKLLARKRPRLLPVYDTVVRDVLGRPDHLWKSLHRALTEEDRALHRRLLTIRDLAGVGDDISALRVLDVVCWRLGMNARSQRP